MSESLQQYGFETNLHYYFKFHIRLYFQRRVVASPRPPRGASIPAKRGPQYNTKKFSLLILDSYSTMVSRLLQHQPFSFQSVSNLLEQMKKLLDYYSQQQKASRLLQLVAKICLDNYSSKNFQIIPSRLLWFPLGLLWAFYRDM